MSEDVASVLCLQAWRCRLGAAGRLSRGQSYKAISISGFDVQNKGLSLTVSRNPGGDGMRGAGNAGCNNWTASVILNNDQIDFTTIVTTKKMCGKPHDDGRRRLSDLASLGQALAR